MDRDAFKASIDTWFHAASGDGDWVGALNATARALGADGMALCLAAQQGEPSALYFSAAASEALRTFCESAEALHPKEDAWHSAKATAAGAIAATAWPSPADGRIMLCLARDASSPLPAPILEELRDSVRRALDVARDVGALRAASALKSDVLDHLPFGVARIDGALRVIEANSAFAQIVRRADGLSAAGGRLICRHSQDQAALATALANTTDENRWTTLRVARATDAAPYAVRVVCPRTPGPARDTRLIIVIDPDTTPPHDSELWRVVFGLTECEIAIAEGIIAGQRMKDVAKLRHVSVETIRTQAKRLYERLGVGTQAEAAARLSRAAPFLGSHAAPYAQAALARRRAGALAA